MTTEQPDNTLKLACAELAGYHDGFMGMPQNATYATSDENLAYILWFGKARAERTQLCDVINLLEKQLAEAQATITALAAEKDRLFGEASDRAMAQRAALSRADKAEAEQQRLTEEKTAWERIATHDANELDLAMDRLAQLQGTLEKYRDEAQLQSRLFDSPRKEVFEWAASLFAKTLALSRTPESRGE